MNTPNGFWATVRRAWIPKKGNAYLPWENFTESCSEMPIPRRFDVGTPTEDDLNYVNKVASAQEQGFTTGTLEPVKLNSEKLWFDKQNPAYGAGPK